MLFLFTQSCKPTKYLNEGEIMLRKINIKGNKNFSSYELEEFYRQKPNRKFLLLPFRPYMHAYYYGEKIFDSTKVELKYEKKLTKLNTKYESLITDSIPSDSSLLKEYYYEKEEILDKKKLVMKEGNWLMRSVGEKIVVYDSSLIHETAVQLQKHLHANGYFRSAVQTNTKIKHKKASAQYQINEKEPYRIKKIQIIGDDKRLVANVKKHYHDQIMEVGKLYNDELLSSERENLTNFLRSNGYFYFHRRYVHFEIDSTIDEKAVHIRTIISNPNNSKHEKYVIKNVYFTTDASKFIGNKTRDTVFYKNIHYLWYQQNVSHKILDRKIKIYPGESYSYINTIQTQKNLADLNMYKFVNINYFETEDSTKNEVNCYISTSPFQKYQFSTELGVNVYQGLPGPFGNLSYRARNLFTGAEILDINIRAGIEGQTSITEPDEILTTKEVGLTSALTFPKFFLPSTILKKYNDFNSRTQLKIGGTLTQRTEFTRDNLTTSLAYLWQKNKDMRFVVTPLEFTLINTRNETDDFKDYIQGLIDANNPLYLSFRKSIISNMRYDFIFDNNLNKQKKRSRYFRLSLESGGTTLNFIQNDIFNETNQLFGLDYYQYLKGLTDFRYYIPTKNKNILASRVSFGVARAIGGTQALPYEKYFFSGGSYSNRAWLPRRLGPGSYMPLTADGKFDTEYKIEQPGEILFESNIEYRFRIKGILDGAIFTDIGNVWTINDDARTGSLFELSDFYNELAIGSGFGFRFDFSFLILRLDVGSKIWDPALALENRFIPKNNSFMDILTDKRLTILNLGIGYPF